MSDVLKIALKALDEIETLRRSYNETQAGKGYMDIEFREAAANIAIEAGIPNRADWTDLLKADPTTAYHKWYVKTYGAKQTETEINDLLTSYK